MQIIQGNGSNSFPILMIIDNSYDEITNYEIVL